MKCNVWQEQKSRLQSLKTTSFAKTQTLLFIFISKATDQKEHFKAKQDPALDETFSSQNKQISVKTCVFFQASFITLTILSNKRHRCGNIWSGYLL